MNKDFPRGRWSAGDDVHVNLRIRKPFTPSCGKCMIRDVIRIFFYFRQREKCYMCCFEVVDHLFPMDQTRMSVFTDVFSRHNHQVNMWLVEQHYNQDSITRFFGIAIGYVTIRVWSCFSSHSEEGQVRNESTGKSTWWYYRYSCAWKFECDITYRKTRRWGDKVWKDWQLWVVPTSSHRHLETRSFFPSKYRSLHTT